MDLRLAFRKAQRRREKRLSEKLQNPPPQEKRELRLMIANKITFLLGP
jgi:hypothetical protein